MQCGQLMKGEPFYLEALSFDRSNNEDRFCLKKVVDSVKDAEKLFKPISATTPEVVLYKQDKANGWNKSRLREVAQKRGEQVAELASLVGSTLDEQEKRESKYKEENMELQKQLEEAMRQLYAAQRVELSTQCCVCKMEAVQIAGGPVSTLHKPKQRAGDSD